jgi:hypothetical protein
LEWSWDAAPADVARTHGLGRSGVTVRAHYGALPSMAGRGQVEGGRNPAGVVLVATSLARKYGPSNRKAAMARRKATRAGCPLSQAGFGARLATQLRLSARHPPHSRGANWKAHFARRRGTDGAWAQITPDIWLFDNCIGNDDGTRNPFALR